MKLFVLDTNAYIAYSLGNRKFFSKLIIRFIEMAESGECIFYVPAVSFWEIARKVLIGKLKFKGLAPEDTLKQIQKPLDTSEYFRDLPLTRKAASIAPIFANKLQDPFDQLIVASAIEGNLPLITKDRTIQESKLVRTVW